MNNEKLDNQLELALDVGEDIRERTLDLNTGYIPENDSWELIVRYNGDIESIVESLGGSATVLLNSYAVVVIAEDRIDELSGYSEVEFIEKPRQLFYEASEAVAASCIPPVWSAPLELTGRGTLIGIIDSGIDFRNDDFRNDDGTTRIRYMLDLNQGGAIFTSDDINRALGIMREDGQASGEGETPDTSGIFPQGDSSGHGTSVAGIACGNGRASDGRYRGVAYGAEMIVVKLGRVWGGRFPGTTGIMRGVDFCIRCAIELNMPLSINISYGNNYGSHTGTSLIETYLNSASGLWKTSIIVGTGNEGASGHHASGRLTPGERVNIEFVIAGYTTSINLQLWKNYSDIFQAELITPSGQRLVLPLTAAEPLEYVLGSTRIIFFYGEPQPYSILQELYFEFIPTANYIESGIWQLVILAQHIVTGEYNLWLPASELSGSETRFLRAAEETTLTIPSTSAGVISVGAYDYRSDSVAYFSGKGFTAQNQIKPDILAPGVRINAPAVNNGYSLRTGTSFAAPFVTGSAALLQQWGIVLGNDAYLYGEKLKAYLIRGARQLPGFDVYPNPQVGWGVLCVRDSLPV